MKRELVSVIIPAYNASRTIKRCLLSVLNQTYDRIEIIVIDDCSTDGTSSQIDSILENVGNKIVVHKKKNEMLEQARLDGVNCSHGSFITFIDADDYIELNAIEKMLNILKQKDADMVQCKCRTFISIGKFLKIHYPRSNNRQSVVVLKKEDIMSKVYMSFFGYGSFNVSAWSKLYRREHLINLKAGGLQYAQDQYMNMQVFPKLNSICVINDALYHYELQGMTSKYKPNYMNSTKRLYQIKLNYAEEMHSNAAKFYSTIELRNCFKAQVESMILHNVDTKENIKKWIAEELMDSTYDVFDWLKLQDKCDMSPMSVAIMDKDVESIYDLARKNVYEWKWKKIARRILVHFN